MVALTFRNLSSRAMFCNDLKEKYEKRIIIKGVDAETMHTLLDYTYTSKALITKQNVQRVLEAANLFQVCEQIVSVLFSRQRKPVIPQRYAWTGSQGCTWDIYTTTPIPTLSWGSTYLKVRRCSFGNFLRGGEMWHGLLNAIKPEQLGA